MQIKRVHWLIGAALVLGSLLYFDVLRDESPIPSPPPGKNGATQRIPTMSVSDELSRLRLTDLSETLRRPLFERTRRAAGEVAPPPKPVVTAGSPPPPIKIELLGVIISGDRSLAVLTVGGAGTHLLDIGDSIGGWEVIAVKLDAVDIAREGEQRTLRLRRR